MIDIIVPPILRSAPAAPLEKMNHWMMIHSKPEYESVEGLKKMIRAEVECGPNRSDIVNRLARHLGALIAEEIVAEIARYSLSLPQMTQSEYRRHNHARKFPTGEVIPRKVAANPRPNNRDKIQGGKKKTAKKKVAKKKVTRKVKAKR